MTRKKYWAGIPCMALVFTMVSPGCILEESWMGEHYGIVTIKNQSSYSLSEIRICEFSDESGLKTVDTSQLPPGGSRSYQHEDGVKLEYAAFSLDGNFKTRHIKISYNNTQKTKMIFLSEGQNVEVVVDDSGMTVANPVYDPSSGQ